MQCPRNNIEREQMKKIPYASAVGSLMYAQTCTRPDIAFFVGMLGRYQSDPRFEPLESCKEGDEQMGQSRGRVKNNQFASSTMEAEFVACFEASSHALWLRNFISGLGVVDSIAKPLRIYCDNTSAVFFSKNGKFSSGSKHMDLKYLVVKERVQKQQVSIENIRTTLMVADPLTKGLPQRHIWNML
ncbi:hypothetical protein AAG906_006592 [Vitis piasezkii]